MRVLRPGMLPNGLTSRATAIRDESGSSTTGSRPPGRRRRPTAARSVGPGLEHLGEIETVGLGGRLGDHGAPQRGRAGRRVVFRLVEELHGTGQAVAQRRETAAAIRRARSTSRSRAETRGTGSGSRSSRSTPSTTSEADQRGCPGPGSEAGSRPAPDQSTAATTAATTQLNAYSATSRRTRRPQGGDSLLSGCDMSIDTVQRTGVSYGSGGSSNDWTSRDGDRCLSISTPFILLSSPQSTPSPPSGPSDQQRNNSNSGQRFQSDLGGRDSTGTWRPAGRSLSSRSASAKV